MIALALLLTTIGFALLGLTTPDHHRRQSGRPIDPARTRRMRAMGWIAFGAAFPVAIVARGWVYGPILWVALLMLGAGLVFLALNYRPGRDSGGKQES